MTSQNTAPKRKRRERGSIDPEDIITGAFELAEEVSVGNLSMPLLGKHLGVGVTSIYWYFRKKDDLLNAMTDRAIARYNLQSGLGPTKGGWRERLEVHAYGMRKAFLQNPILCDLILIRSTLSARAGQLGAKEIERHVENLMEAGLSLEEAYDCYSAVQLHVRGTVVLERLYEINKAEDAGSQAYYENLVITPDETPLLAQATALGHVGGAPNDRNFEFGLNCILEYIEARVDDAQSAGPTTKTPERKSTAKKATARKTAAAKA